MFLDYGLSSDTPVVYPGDVLGPQPDGWIVPDAVDMQRREDPV